MLEVTKREAAQIASGRQKVIRRAFHKHDYKPGVKIPLVLKGERSSEPVLVVECLGVAQHTLGVMDDGRAKDEVYDSLAAWKLHWESLYRGTNRVNADTVVTALRVRKTDLERARVKE